MLDHLLTSRCYINFESLKYKKFNKYQKWPLVFPGWPRKICDLNLNKFNLKSAIFFLPLERSWGSQPSQQIITNFENMLWMLIVS